jgi:hypothetical protein
VQFQLHRDELHASPFFRNQGEEFDNEAALGRPSPSLAQEDSVCSAGCLSCS